MASEKRVVLITGAGSGIGMASALEYAKNDFIVVATMRFVPRVVTSLNITEHWKNPQRQFRCFVVEPTKLFANRQPPEMWKSQ